MDRLSSKEPSDQLMSFLKDSKNFEASDEQIKEIFLECILQRTKKSLEHLKKFVELYQNIFFDFYGGTQLSQIKAI